MSKSCSGFTIPKKPRLDKDLPPEPQQTQPVIAERFEVRVATKQEHIALVRLLPKPRPTEKFAENRWKLTECTKVELITNPELERKFNACKRNMPSKEEFFGFRMVFNRTEEEEIVHEGLKAINDAIPDIGDPGKGVVVYNSPMTAYAPRLLYDNAEFRMIMYRTIRGRAHQTKIESGSVTPTKSHNCHIAYKQEFDIDGLHELALLHRTGAVYHYELDSNSHKFLTTPSMLLPHAILTFKKRDSNIVTRFDPENQISYSVQKPTMKCYGTHIIMLGDCSHKTDILKPVIGIEAAAALTNGFARPVAYRMRDVKNFRILNLLRNSLYGKLLTSEFVNFDGPPLEKNSASYVCLKTRKNFAKLLKDNGVFLVWAYFKWTVFYIPSGHAAAEFGFPHLEDCLHVIIFCKDVTNQSWNQLSGRNPDNSILIDESYKLSAYKKKNIVSNNKLKRVSFPEANFVQVRILSPLYSDNQEASKALAHQKFAEQRKRECMNETLQKNELKMPRKELSAAELREKQECDALFRKTMGQNERNRVGFEGPKAPPVHSMNNAPRHSFDVHPAPINASLPRNSREEFIPPQPVNEATRRLDPPVPFPGKTHMTGPPSVPPPNMYRTPPPNFQRPPFVSELSDPRLQPNRPPGNPVLPVPPQQRLPPAFPPPTALQSDTSFVDFSRPPPSIVKKISPPTPVFPSPQLPQKPQAESILPDMEIGEAPMDLSFEDNDEERMIVEKPEPDGSGLEPADDPSDDDQDMDSDLEDGPMVLEDDTNDILKMAWSQNPREEEPKPACSFTDKIADTLKNLTPSVKEFLRKKMDASDVTKNEVEAPLKDVDFRIPTGIAFPISKPKPPQALSTNVLGDYDDDEEQGDSSAHSSQDVDLRKPSTSGPKQSLVRDVPKDRDDRLKDIDERPELIPLPPGEPETKREHKKLGDLLQGKLHANMRNTDEAVKASYNNQLQQQQLQQQQQLTPTPFTQSQLSSYGSFTWLRNLQITADGFIPVTQGEPSKESQPVEPGPEPKPIESPGPIEIAEPDEDAYSPKTFLNQQSVVTVPTEPKDGYNMYRADSVSSHQDAIEKSPRKHGRKPVDYDHVRKSKSSDHQVNEKWSELVGSKKRNYSNEVEEGEIDSDEDKKRSQYGEGSSSRVDWVDSLEDMPRYQSGNNEPTASKLTSRPNPRYRPNRGHSRPFSHGFRGSGRGFYSNQYNSIGNYRNLPSIAEFIRRMPLATDNYAQKYSIFIDLDRGLETLKVTELDMLFSDMSKLRKQTSSAVRYHCTVYVHSRLYNLMHDNTSSLAKYFKVFLDFKSPNHQVVEVLEQHSCDALLPLRVNDLAECIRSVNSRKGGVEAIYVTHDVTDPDVRQSLISRNVNLMSMREILGKVRLWSDQQ